MKALGKVYDDFFEKIINEHVRDWDHGEQTKDIVDTMMSIMQSGKTHEFQFDRRHVKAIMLDMLAGSMDTAASSVEWILSELLRNPTTMKKFRRVGRSGGIGENGGGVGHGPTRIPRHGSSPIRLREERLPGMQLGLIQVRLIVSQLVHCFDWRLPNGVLPEELDMTEEFGLVVARANHLMAIPTLRLQI
ncbi:UNVERIFIED_CONTAM: cytochrome [Sesamum latifolium]|uniref:Cytochrome n=1 Tax=Sesamum latifolium TaxID=2727402 RepID=A0AAW2S352_9LAMI